MGIKDFFKNLSKNNYLYIIITLIGLVGSYIGNIKFISYLVDNFIIFLYNIFGASIYALIRMVDFVKGALSYIVFFIGIIGYYTNVLFTNNKLLSSEKLTKIEKDKYSIEVVCATMQIMSLVIILFSVTIIKIADIFITFKHLFWSNNVFILIIMGSLFIGFMGAPFNNKCVTNEGVRIGIRKYLLEYMVLLCAVLIML